TDPDEPGEPGEPGDESNGGPDGDDGNGPGVGEDPGSGTGRDGDGPGAGTGGGDFAADEGQQTGNLTAGDEGGSGRGDLARTGTESGHVAAVALLALLAGLGTLGARRRMIRRCPGVTEGGAEPHRPGLGPLARPPASSGTTRMDPVCASPPPPASVPAPGSPGLRTPAPRSQPQALIV